MSTRTEVLTGAVVLIAAGAFLTYALRGTDLGGGASYPLVASFRSVDGVSVGSDVRLAGVKVGSVRSMALNPDSYRAEMTVDIDRSIAVPEDSTIAIGSDGLLGGAYVELIPGAMDPLPSGAEIENTQGAVSLIGLLMKFVAANEGT